MNRNNNCRLRYGCNIKIFTFQISFGKYVNRRLLTEAYRKNRDKYDGYKWNETVEGIKNFKRRMKTEFGDPIKQLQDKITLDEIDDMIFDEEMRRFCKKKDK